MAEAACRVFVEKGYRRAHVSDVAAALGLSQGAVYGYVESKEALFQLAMTFAIGKEALDRVELPMATPGPGQLLLPLRMWDSTVSFPILLGALGRPKADNVRDEFGAVIDELYALLQRNRLLLSLISPYLAPVWITGLIRLFRDRSLRWCRVLGWAYVLLVMVFVITGGKSYYLGGALPLLIAAGAQPTVNWLHRGRAGVRQCSSESPCSLTIPSTILLTLPVVPVAGLHSTRIVSLNYDEGETVGWPMYVRQVARAYRTIQADQRDHVAILTGNYGEAGAIDRFGSSSGLPAAFTGQDGYWYWGPPPKTEQSAVVVGLKAHESSEIFAHCGTVGLLNNGVGLDDQEQGKPIRICSDLRSSWVRLWPTGAADSERAAHGDQDARPRRSLLPGHLSVTATTTFTLVAGAGAAPKRTANPQTCVLGPVICPDRHRNFSGFVHGPSDHHDYPGFGAHRPRSVPARYRDIGW